MRKELKEKTIRKFKGINASRSNLTYESFGPAEDQLVDINNFNINPSGFMEKRWGVDEVCRIVNPITPTYLRILGSLRYSNVPAGGFPQIVSYNYVYMTDGSRVWRINVDTGTYTDHTFGSTAAPIQGAMWMVEYGGTNQPYYGYIVRQAAGITASIGGIMQINPSKNNMEGNSGWNANTPVGTHMTLFKDRLWVINSNGSTELTGNETKVWYSNATTPINFGGAALNNFNLDFGDGDYLVTSIPFNDQLYFFKTRKTYVVGADGAPADWTYRIASERVGCVGRGTVKIIDGKMYFLSLEGVVRFDGAQAELISENVKDLLETYRDYKDPSSVLNVYASHWNNKYILWLPTTSDFTYYTNALVYDIPSSTWTKWTLTNNVSAFGETRFSELSVDSLFLGSASTAGGKTNRLWRMSSSSWTDDTSAYTCSFTTKKLDFGAPMSQKRVFAVAATVKNEPTDTAASYQISTYTDNSFGYSSASAPAKFSVMNLKARGAGYGRYFYSTVSLTASKSYAALYDLTFLAEERGLEPYSRPLGSRVEQVPIANIFKAGPDNNDRLTSGFILR